MPASAMHNDIKLILSISEPFRPYYIPSLSRVNISSQYAIQSTLKERGIYSSMSSRSSEQSVPVGFTSSVGEIEILEERVCYRRLKDREATFFHSKHLPRFHARRENPVLTL